jgi:hypothetical protein
MRLTMNVSTRSFSCSALLGVLFGLPRCGGIKVVSVILKLMFGLGVVWKPEGSGESLGIFDEPRSSSPIGLMYVGNNLDPLLIMQLCHPRVVASLRLFPLEPMTCLVLLVLAAGSLLVWGCICDVGFGGDSDIFMGVFR